MRFLILIFVNENSTGEITTKAANKFKSTGFDEIRLLTEYVETLYNTNLTRSRLLLVCEYNTYKGNDAKQPKGFRKASRGEVSIDDDSFSWVVSHVRSYFHLSSLLKDVFMPCRTAEELCYNFNFLLA